jgi:hypothetical protein
MTNSKQPGNLEIWDRLSKTPTEFTKPAEFDGRKLTTINGTWVVKRLTEEFGPVGVGWGYDVLEERYDKMNPILNDQGHSLGFFQIHTIKICAWAAIPEEPDTRFIKWPWKKQSRLLLKSVHYGHTPAVYKTQWGVKYDSDPVKKSLTDALKKAASMFGMSSDVYLGQYENPDYLDQMQSESIEREIETNSAKYQEGIEVLETWFTEVEQKLSMIKAKAALKQQFVMSRKILDAKIKPLNLPVNQSDALKRKLYSIYERLMLELSPPMVDLVCRGCGSRFQGAKPGDKHQCGSTDTIEYQS